MTKKVLVVDDDQTICDLLSMKFSAQPDIEVLSANSGESGLQMATQHVPDLIYLDVMMPDLSGDEVYGKLSEIDSLSNTKVIFLTSIKDAGSEDGGIEKTDYGYWMVSKDAGIDKIVELGMGLIS